jgi:predicted metallo-beta-lactamase superfamily hydrolase
MKITPLAADSMGSRSMAVFLETRHGKILIDPGASLAPLRHGLSPHPLEQWQLKKHLDRIRLFAESAQIIMITSFHPDHYHPDKPEWMKNKILFLKNPNQQTTPAERKSAFQYLKVVKKIAEQLHFADERTFSFGKFEFQFSPAYFNGQEYFIQVLIRSGDSSFLFSSNVQGPASDRNAEFMLGRKADVIYWDGPITYLHKQENVLAPVLERMKKIVIETGTKHVLLDHHTLRDLQWQKHMEPFISFALDHGIRIQTSAEYRGEEPTPLEARRNQLFENQAQS